MWYQNLSCKSSLPFFIFCNDIMEIYFDFYWISLFLWERMRQCVLCIKIVCMVDIYLTASQLSKYLPFFTSISVLSVRSFFLCVSSPNPGFRVRVLVLIMNAHNITFFYQIKALLEQSWNCDEWSSPFSNHRKFQQPSLYSCQRNRQWEGV